MYSNMKCSPAFSEELRIIYHLDDGLILELNKFEYHNKEDIISIINGFGWIPITIGWNTDNPRICVNKNE